MIYDTGRVLPAGVHGQRSRHRQLARRPVRSGRHQLQRFVAAVRDGKTQEPSSGGPRASRRFSTPPRSPIASTGTRRSPDAGGAAVGLGDRWPEPRGHRSSRAGVSNPAAICVVAKRLSPRALSPSSRARREPSHRKDRWVQPKKQRGDDPNEQSQIGSGYPAGFDPARRARGPRERAGVNRARPDRRGRRAEVHDVPNQSAVHPHQHHADPGRRLQAAVHPVRRGAP